jgi:hypothetical protein
MSNKAVEFTAEQVEALKLRVFGEFERLTHNDNYRFIPGDPPRRGSIADLKRMADEAGFTSPDTDQRFWPDSELPSAIGDLFEAADSWMPIQDIRAWLEIHGVDARRLQVNRELVRKGFKRKLGAAGGQYWGVKQKAS